MQKYAIDNMPNWANYRKYMKKMQIKKAKIFIFSVMNQEYAYMSKIE